MREYNMLNIASFKHGVHFTPYHLKDSYNERIMPMIVPAMKLRDCTNINIVELDEEVSEWIRLRLFKKEENDIKLAQTIISICKEHSIDIIIYSSISSIAVNVNMISSYGVHMIHEEFSLRSSTYMTDKPRYATRYITKGIKTNDFDYL